jgi:hypothetical protein
MLFCLLKKGSYLASERLFNSLPISNTFSKKKRSEGVSGRFSYGNNQRTKTFEEK